MLYLLDTDILIFVLRGLKSPARQRTRRDKAKAIVGRCRAAQDRGDNVGLSAITVTELEFGAQKSGRYETEIAAVRKLLTPFELFDYDGLSCPPHYGRIRHDLDRSGHPIGAMDLLIAAHAMTLGATLVTNNLSHFRHIAGLKTMQWG